MAMNPIRNENATTLRDLGAELDVGANVAVDRTGKLLTKIVDGGTSAALSIIPLSQGATAPNGLGTIPFGFRRRANLTAETGTTTTVINATAHGATIGDGLYVVSGNATEGFAWVTATTTNTFTVSPALRAAPANGDNLIIGIPSPTAAVGAITGSAFPLLGISVMRGDGAGAIGAGSGAGFLLKDEDLPHASGDTGVMALAVNNKNTVSFNGTQGDYSPIGVNDYGFIPTSTGGSFQNILTATTTTVKSGAGILHRIIVNKAVALSTYTIFDNTAGSGTKVGTVTQPASVLESQTVLEYRLRFSTGLTIVTSSTDDITVVWD